MKFTTIYTKYNDIKISNLVLGTDYFGTTVTQQTAFELMDLYVANGGNCLDTARVYADWLPNGHGASERLIGEWLKSRKNRNALLISTKGGHPPLDNMAQGRLSRTCIEGDLEESLKALDIEHIDIYWLHRDDLTTPVSEIMETLHTLVQKGKVRAVGCSNWSVQRIKQANDFALKNNLTPFCASQIQWSLACSTPDVHKDPTIVCMNDDEYRGYLDLNMPIMAYSSQAKGFFAKAAAQGLETINQKAFARFCTPENIQRLERVKQYASEQHLTPTAVALGYILCNRISGMAIVGCKSTEQLKDTLTAQDVTMTEETVNWLQNG
ncbi:MAG: aldo/keto reductase [Hyphomonadaceae bacterium]|nr:aldo/keto reductase [Clostridia bacterium]